MKILRDKSEERIALLTDSDRLTQVFINLMTNAQKYCDAAQPSLRVQVHQRAEGVDVDFVDNGSGIPTGSQDLIFEKFARLSDQSRAGGAGLGLAICREVLEKLVGAISYLPGQGGAAFRVSLPTLKGETPAQ